MGLLKQKDNQYYVSNKSFISDGVTANYTISPAQDSFHLHHQQLNNQGEVNPSVKVYVDGVYYNQRIDPAGVTLPYDQWYFWLDTNPATGFGWNIEFETGYIPANGAVIDVRIDNSLWQNLDNGVTELTTNDYQVTSLEDVIGSFMIAYVGEDKLISKVNRTDVQFHAMRTLQELSFDTLKSCKSQEIEIPPSLTMVLPRDYVNYVKLSWKDSSGIKRVLYPTDKTSNPFPISQTDNGEYLFEDDIDPVRDDLVIDKDSDTWTAYKSATSINDQNDDYDDNLYWANIGARYGIDPQHAQANGSYFIDCARGIIHFSSNVSGKTVILDYISDSLGTDQEMVVHKFAEEAMYKSLMYAILSTRSNIQEHIVQRYKKERFAAVRKAKLRLSNIKLEELTQILRGKSKFIKH